MRTILLSIIFVGVLAGCGEKGPAPEPLVMFCAAGMKKPVTKIAEQYEAEYGIPIRLQFGGSGTLLSSLDIADGDIYLAADSSYTDIAKEKGLLAETMPVALMKAGIAVAKGNPKGVSKLSDVKNPDLKIGIGHPEAASVGKFTKKVLIKNGLWKGFEPAVLFPTVNELANALKLGSIDAAIIWDAIANQYPDIDFVSVPEFDAEKKDITVGILTSSKQPTAALKFCRYLSSRNRGLKVFKADGYAPVDGDVWVENPEVVLFSGSMLRPAIEKTIEKFEKREGVRISPVFNGCGILVSQMKAGQQPDAYFSCDISFMEMVQDRFSESTLVSANEMVILVQKGNPKGILKLTDLKKNGIKVGLSHPEKSALGALTKKMLAADGLYQPLLDSGNVMPGSATGDFLVNQIRAASLDAVIVYRSNALSNTSTVKDCDIIGINHPQSVAEQPFAIGRGSEHRYLLQRFFKACVTGEGKEAFLKYGFRWELDE